MGNPNVKEGRPHSYNVTVPLGPSQGRTASEVAAQVFTRKNFFLPVKHDPKDADKPFQVGDKFDIKMLGTTNSVEVTERTPNSMKLTAQKGHTFEGSANHQLEVGTDNQIYHKVEGRGVPGENCAKAKINEAVGPPLWHVADSLKVKPMLNPPPERTPTESARDAMTAPGP